MKSLSFTLNLILFASTIFFSESRAFATRGGSNDPSLDPIVLSTGMVISADLRENHYLSVYTVPSSPTLYASLELSNFTRSVVLRPLGNSKFIVLRNAKTWNNDADQWFETQTLTVAPSGITIEKSQWISRLSLNLKTAVSTQGGGLILTTDGTKLVFIDPNGVQTLVEVPELALSSGQTARYGDQVPVPFLDQAGQLYLSVDQDFYKVVNGHMVSTGLGFAPEHFISLDDGTFMVNASGGNGRALEHLGSDFKPLGRYEFDFHHLVLDMMKSTSGDLIVLTQKTGGFANAKTSLALIKPGQTQYGTISTTLDLSADNTSEFPGFYLSHLRTNDLAVAFGNKVFTADETTLALKSSYTIEKGAAESPALALGPTSIVIGTTESTVTFP